MHWAKIVVSKITLLITHILKMFIIGINKIKYWVNENVVPHEDYYVFFWVDLSVMWIKIETAMSIIIIIIYIKFPMLKIQPIF